MHLSASLLLADAEASSSRVRKRPAAAAASTPLPRQRHMGTDHPSISSSVSSTSLQRPLGYASDCSGLDCGSLALRYLGLSFDHMFASELNPKYRDILKATHPRVETVYDDVTKRELTSLSPFLGRTTIYTAGFPCQCYSRQGSQLGEEDPSGNGAVVWHVLLTITGLLPDVSSSKM